MAADDTAQRILAPLLAEAVPEQSRRRAGGGHPDRLVRQVQAIDAWVAARREREQAWHAPSKTRDERMDVDRQIEVLRRTHDAIKGRCARGLGAEVEAMRSSGPTAVIAHRHVWFVDKVALLLGERGIAVVACTDNGAEALGAVVAEQPDIVLVGDRLAMMSGHVLLAETRRFAPSALRSVQASDQQQADALQDAADAVFLRHHPPAVVADALVALHVSAARELDTG
jgi:CheY-like chemotaxis protein